MQTQWVQSNSHIDTFSVTRRVLAAKKLPSDSAKPDTALEDMSKRVSSAAQKLFKVVDTTGDGQIEKFEMVAAADKLHLTEEEAEKLFDVLDTDDSGMLTLDEFSSYDIDSASPGMPSSSDDAFFSEVGPSTVSVSVKITTKNTLTETQKATLKTVITDLAGIEEEAIVSFEVEGPAEKSMPNLRKPAAPAPAPEPAPGVPKPTATKQMPAMPMFPNPAAMVPPSSEDTGASKAALPVPMFALPPAPDSAGQGGSRRRLSNALTVILEVGKKDANAVSIALADDTLSSKLKAADSSMVVTVDTRSVNPPPVEYVTLKLLVDSELTEAQETTLKDVISKEAGLDKSAVTKFKILLTPIAKLFKLVDTSGDGKIQKDEMVSAASKLHLSGSEAADLFDELDADGSGYLSLEEFEATENPAQFISLFELVDLDGSGTISKEEIIAAADKLQMTEDEAADMFYELDVDGSGFLSEDEFGPAEASGLRRRLSEEVSVLMEVPYGSAASVSTAVSEDNFPEKVVSADSSLMVKTLSVSPAPQEEEAKSSVEAKDEDTETDLEAEAREEDVDVEVEDAPEEEKMKAEVEEKPKEDVEDEGTEAGESPSPESSDNSETSNKTLSRKEGSDDASAASKISDLGESLADVNQVSQVCRSHCFNLLSCLHRLVKN
jgi:Ca2+-binding EF-hand superfamily protein